MTNGIDDAIDQATSQTALAVTLGVTQQAVHRWQKRGWVPAKRAQQIETLYGIDRMRLINPRLRDLVEAD